MLYWWSVYCAFWYCKSDYIYTTLYKKGGEFLCIWCWVLVRVCIRSYYISYMKYEVIIYIVCLFFASITHVHTLSPYSVLRLAPGASDLEVEKQYKKLRSRNRNSRTKKTMIRSAYSSIMNQRKYKNNKE